MKMRPICGILGLLLVKLYLVSAVNSIGTAGNENNGRQIQIPFFNWLFGNPLQTNSSSVNNTAENQTKFDESLVPFDDLPVTNNTFKHFVLKKEAQSRINDQIFLHNQRVKREFGNPKETFDLKGSPSASSTTQDSQKQRTERQLERREYGYREPSVYVPFHHGPPRRSHHHRWKHPRLSSDDSENQSSTQLLKRQGIFSMGMTMTPQQQLYLQQAAAMQQQQQLMALNAYSNLGYGGYLPTTTQRRRRPAAPPKEEENDSDYEEEGDYDDDENQSENSDDDFDSEEFMMGAIRSGFLPPTAMSAF